MGPDTKPLGEIKTESQYYQNQITKTAAAFLGLVGKVISQRTDRQLKFQGFKLLVKTFTFRKDSADLRFADFNVTLF